MQGSVAAQYRAMNQTVENFFDDVFGDGTSDSIQAGAYKSLNNAKELQGRLEKMGVISEINLYKV